MPVTRYAPTCTNQQRDCRKPIHREGLCMDCLRLWEYFGGDYPGAERRRYVMAENDGIYEVMDTTSGQVVVSSEVKDDAFDEWSMLRQLAGREDEGREFLEGAA